MKYKNHSGNIQAPIPGELIEAVRAVSPIEEVVGERVQLRTSGAEFKGRCPFHADKTPSFAVNPAKGLFHCHACNAGGDVFEFVRILRKCSFRKSVESLAARAGFHLGGFEPSPELVARVSAIKAEYENELAFERFCNHRIGAINARCRALARAATHAEECLRAGGLAVFEEQLAWDALERYRTFELRVEREGLCDPSVIRTEWELIRDAA